MLSRTTSANSYSFLPLECLEFTAFEKARDVTAMSLFPASLTRIANSTGRGLRPELETMRTQSFFLISQRLKNSLPTPSIRSYCPPDGSCRTTTAASPPALNPASIATILECPLPNAKTTPPLIIESAMIDPAFRIWLSSAFRLLIASSIKEKYCMFHTPFPLITCGSGSDHNAAQDANNRNNDKYAKDVTCAYFLLIQQIPCKQRQKQWHERWEYAIQGRL